MTGEPWDTPITQLYWNPGDPLPPWKPPTKKSEFAKYRLAMIDFVRSQIKQIPLTEEEEAFCTPEEAERVMKWHENLGPEIKAARNGDIEPLRRKLPHIAEFLHIPTGPVGKRKTGGYPTSSYAQFAANLVPIVKVIWKKHYDGKKVRRLKPTTEEIVADYFRVTVKDVKRELSRNKLKRHKVKKQKANKPRKTKKHRETVSS